MTAIDGPLLMEILVSAGAFTAIGETARWFLTRGRQRIDSAKVVQGMALDMLKPLHDELQLTADDMANLRAEVNEAQADVAALLAWSLSAKRILDFHDLPYPAVPLVMRPTGNDDSTGPHR